MTETLIIAPRFCGPPGSGHGGYVCGRIAAYLDAPATVTLRRPPPLATAMTVELDHTATVRVLADGTLIAEAVTTPDAPARDAPARDAPAPDLPGPAPGLPDPAPGLPGSVSMAEARAAGAGSRVRTHPDEHPFPGCFACGPDRAPGDGLRVMVGPVAGRDLSARPR